MSDIPIWTLEQLTDPAFRKAIGEHANELHGHVIMQFTDGQLEVSARMAYLNLFWLDVPTQFGIPLCKRHFLKRFNPSNSGLMKAWTVYYEEIMDLDAHNGKRLKQVLWDKLQDLYKFCSVDILEYTRTIDILDMAEIMTDPAVAPIIDTKYEISTAMGTAAVEKFIDYHKDKLMDLFGTKGAIKNDALYVYRKVDQLNKFQTPQMLYAYGPRTDVDDTIITLPVKGSAVAGIQDIQEFAVESLSAKKSSFYNKVAVSDAQYFGRKQHLIASSIMKVYDEDCGTTNYVRYNVTKRNYSGIVGKHIYDETGKTVRVTKDMAVSLVGTTIKMRSPLTCKGRRGVCACCGGDIFRNINRNANLGILSAIQVIERITQPILSSKHLIRTVSLVYQLTPEAKEILTKKAANEIHWHPAVTANSSKYAVGFDVKDITRFHDINYISDDKDKPIKEELFSKITKIYLRNIDSGNTVEYQLDTGNAAGQYLYLSDKFLLHFRDNHILSDNGEGADRVWVPIQGTEKMPIFKYTVVNDNMRTFVSRAAKFLSSDIKSYTSCSEALQAFSDLVRDKVDDINIVHLEVLLKAYLVTSETDFRIPCVEDPDKVKFSSNAAILANRTVGTQLGFQDLGRYMATTSTYLTPKMKSPFDLFIGYDSY